VALESGVLFEVLTPLGFTARVTGSTWSRICFIKHPVMTGRESSVMSALQNPDQVRRSRTDPSICLFYRSETIGRWTCAVVKQIGIGGFLITAYPTDSIKEGELLWPK
jgi:hypothetical protein